MLSEIWNDKTKPIVYGGLILAGLGIIGAIIGGKIGGAAGDTIKQVADKV